jgi:hypothetical protein
MPEPPADDAERLYADHHRKVRAAPRRRFIEIELRAGRHLSMVYRVDAAGTRAAQILLDPNAPTGKATRLMFPL